MNQGPDILQPVPVDEKKPKKEPTIQPDPDWQSTKRNMRQRHTEMFMNELMADVYFIVGHGSTQRRIPAHKYMMATGSSVFYAMFYGRLAEDQKEITIPDVEPEAFLNLMQWVHITCTLSDITSMG